MHKIESLLTCLENFFAKLRPTQASETANVSCRIAENDAGGFSIFLDKTHNVRIGNYASYADAIRVAKKYNFFEVID